MGITPRANLQAGTGVEMAGSRDPGCERGLEELALFGFAEWRLGDVLCALSIRRVGKHRRHGTAPGAT